MNTNNLEAGIDSEFSKLFSTYGLVTVERILDNFGLKLTSDEIYKAIHDVNSIYYQLLIIPFRNILNGIIMQQVEDYREYLQKLFVDYLLSGAANETDEQPPAEGSKAGLEEERKKLIQIGEEFDNHVFKHHTLISHSQKELISISRSSFKNIAEASEEDKALLAAIVSKYQAKSQEIHEAFREFRRKIQKLIIAVQELSENLPDYRADPEKINMHRESIQFDANLGEENLK
ncbi:MAG: hypothetical protein A3E88_03405 [Legionellales bacterium RIFCSPHIGHO2_12_FULL_35_11]|nr:MAG: hypothetical protein A3E88_03405 [Legionellales bacterium RIFCSPHIGHO2_12_FULL_35_11]